MKQQELGTKGEAFAKRELQKKGYRILACNYRKRGGEIDLIAQKGNILVFVEVKTRSRHALYAPREAVTVATQRRIQQTALLYQMETGKMECQPRFDVFEIWTEQNADFQVLSHTHIENAF